MKTKPSLAFNSIFTTRCLSLLFGMMILLSPQARAAVIINVDINGGSTNTYSGQGGYSDPGHNTWNGFNIGGGGSYNATVTSGALVDSAGGASSVLLTLNGLRGFDFASFNGGSLAAGNALIDDVAYSPNSDTAPTIPGFTFATGYHAGFRLSGLTPGASYSLYLFASSGINANSTDFNVSSTVQTVTGRTSATSPTLFTQGTDYALYSSVTADGSGFIDGYLKGTTSQGTFSGLQLIAVPEPSSFALGFAGMGVAALAICRRARRLS